MKEGDKVKTIKGIPFGKIGIIKRISYLKGPEKLSDMGLERDPDTKVLYVEAEDGSTFQGTEDIFELIE